MSLTTITTVGYMEIHPLHRAGRIFNVFLIFFGVTTLFLAIGTMTQTIIEMQLGEAFNKRRMKRMIENLKDHYIVCGYGRVGRGAASELKTAGVPLLVVDRDPEKAARAVRAGLLTLVADSTRDESLRDAGIARARGVIAALETDADNLFLVLSAKALNPNISVAARASEEESEEKLRRVGANVVFTPYNITGHRLAMALLRPSVFEFLHLTNKNIGLDVSIEELKVHASSDYVSKSLRQIQIRRDLGVIVLAIRKADGQMLFNPPAEAELAGNDTLIAMGAAENLKRLETLLRGGNA
jgi:voltage-gated potassium channel